ncbi:RsiV family protein [Pseudomonadota bacterium AL_CKDN230030165-1A_HGKHYDSX7]
MPGTLTLTSWRTLAAATALAALAGCASSPPADISLPPGGAQAATANPALPAGGRAVQVGNLRTERIEWKGVKPECSGECPRIEIDSVAFPDIPQLTKLVDRVLASLTGVDENLRGQYDSLSTFVQYFWRNAQGRDTTYFKAQVRDVQAGVIAVELHTAQYFTGAAHGIPATVFINWQVATNSVVPLDALFIPGRKPEFEALQKNAHQRWLGTNEDAQRDRAAYDRMWPFQPSENYALTEKGMIIKYDAYSIAPYSHGEPELLIPYDQLRGVLKPEFLPRG